MKYSLDKYKFYQFKNENGGITIVAASSYAGKTVKGYAKCDPRDEFSIEKGKELAAARCNLKIAEKRKMRAGNKYIQASIEADKAVAYFASMKQYFMDADDQVDDARAELEALMANY
jgi:hypothetical protein